MNLIESGKEYLKLTKFMAHPVLFLYFLRFAFILRTVRPDRFKKALFQYFPEKDIPEDKHIVKIMEIALELKNNKEPV